MSQPQKIAFQGEMGANSHIACRDVCPDYEPLACATFEDAFAAVSEGQAARAMIPIENSIAGRVADVHHLVPEAGLYISREYFMPIRYHLMAPKGATLDGLKRVRSHIQTIGQCRKTLRAMGVTAMTTVDNAGAAREVMELNDPTEAALAPPLAADLYGLDVLQRDVADAAHNTTRFLVFAPEPDDAEPDAGPCMTSFVFRVRNIPAALYKAMGGFATNGVNIVKLESYIEGFGFNVAMFYADVEGHPASRNVRLAMEELQFFSSQLKILGVYPADPWRKTAPA